ncbi:MAG TPA: M1 family metallopeptidase [Candidatus Avamphibacillus sp.]|nr:M1 family metallopeptidase [Candidatus Avamphibacillus sp.]
MKKYWFLFVTLLFISLAACDLTDAKNETNDIEEKDLSQFQPEGVPPGSESNYNISLKMNEKETFTIEADIQVRNVSEDNWETLEFYFIPNMFTAENSRSLEKPATLDIDKVVLNGEAADYTLKEDNLSIELKEELIPEETIDVKFLYSFTLPEEGLRFTKNNSSFYLAQWYPMVPTYRNGWNKEAFAFKGETYHTPYSNFEINYDIPEAYTVITTSEQDEFPSKNNNTLTAEQVKEFFIAIIDEPTMIEKKVGETSIRVFSLEDDAEKNDELTEVAASAFKYFEDKIGPYPFEELDVILDELGMEYPGVVTAGSIYNKGNLSTSALKQVVVHEIAHQWFYGMISNDPYHDPWLDEGITQFATFLFLSEYEGLDFDFTEEERYAELELPVNLSLNEYPPGERSSSYIYGKSSFMLGRLFQEQGGKEEAESFLRDYFKMYQHKEVNTEEFIRFMEFYFDFDDRSVFDGWLEEED